MPCEALPRAPHPPFFFSPSAFLSPTLQPPPLFLFFCVTQGASCGFGMRGQKSRAGSGVRPGFEGGQTPLYRRMPKLKGIAGGV